LSASGGLGKKTIYGWALSNIDIQSKYLNASRSAVKPDGNIALFHNNRNLSHAIGIFQHGLHLLSISLNIHVFNFLTLFGKSFTSLICIGSGIFSENQYLIRHEATSPRKSRIKSTIDIS
jgi:hypothetical protein